MSAFGAARAERCSTKGLKLDFPRKQHKGATDPAASEVRRVFRECWRMVSGLHLSLGNAQVQVAQHLQFAVRSAHVSAADGEILLSRRQRGLQISLHVALLELAEGRNFRSKQGANALEAKVDIGMETKVKIHRRSSGSYQRSARPGTDPTGGLHFKVNAAGGGLHAWGSFSSSSC